MTSSINNSSFASAGDVFNSFRNEPPSVANHDESGVTPHGGARSEKSILLFRSAFNDSVGREDNDHFRCLSDCESEKMR